MVLAVCYRITRFILFSSFFFCASRFFVSLEALHLSSFSSFCFFSLCGSRKPSPFGVTPNENLFSTNPREFSPLVVFWLVLSRDFLPLMMVYECLFLRCFDLLLSTEFRDFSPLVFLSSDWCLWGTFLPLVRFYECFLLTYFLPKDFCFPFRWILRIIFWTRFSFARSI